MKRSKELAEALIELLEMNIKLQMRIDKAIEYIKLASNKFEYLDTEETKELLEILGDKE